MRLFILFGTLASIVCGSAAAQTCETMVIRDATGQVISNSLMCVDGSGAWVDPTTRSLSGQAIPRSLESSVEPFQFAPASPLPAAKPVPPAPVIAVQPQPTYVPAPQFASPALTYDEQPAAVYTEPVPQTGQWEPTSGVERRKQLYAKLGLVCSARRATFCGAGNVCTGRCEGQQGWCDGKTGVAHASLESIERANCRKKKRR